MSKTKTVKEIADALTGIRLDQSLTKLIGINNPHAKLFATETGIKMSNMARSFNNVCVEFTPSRCQHLTHEFYNKSCEFE